MSSDHKTTLLLDLDETCFVAIPQAGFEMESKNYEDIKLLRGIHSAHQLSPYYHYAGHYLFVINPQKLKTMIEKIYQNKDDIYIFTSGLWQRDVLTIIADACDLSGDIREKWLNAGFLNPQHDSQSLGFAIEDIRRMYKSYRLHGLFRGNPELRKRHFVLLDNDPGHIASTEISAYLTGIQATTMFERDDFYQEVLTSMSAAHEKGMPISPPKIAYAYPSEILRHYISILPHADQSHSKEKAEVTSSTIDFASATDNYHVSFFSADAKEKLSSIKDPLYQSYSAG